MTSVADRAQAILPEAGEAPWPDHEYVRGWGVFGLPFTSGHVLALRVFPQNSFAPYVTVWHRDPEGRWSITADAPDPAIACPRYYGQACQGRVYSSRIRLTWEGPRQLLVQVDEPELEWRLKVRPSPVLAALNLISAGFPQAGWRSPRLRRVRELMARGLGLGEIELAGAMPSGHQGVLMPARMYLIGESSAVLGGADLGRATRLAVNPDIGGVPLPARGVLSFGEAVWSILDPEEFRRTKAAVAVSAGADRAPGAGG